MAVEVGNFDPSGVADKIGGIFTLTKEGVMLMFLAILTVTIVSACAWILWEFMRTFARASVYDEKTREFKHHVIKKVFDRKTKETSYILSGTKEMVSPEITRNKYRIKRTYICPISRGIDGQLRPIIPITDFYDPETGEQRPYYKPVDTNLKDHIWHDMKRDTFKYKLTSTAEKIAPYATFALIAVMSMMFWYVTNGR